MSKAFANIKKGLKEAITHQKGKARDAKTPTPSQSKRNIGKELVEGFDLDHTQQVEALIETLRKVYGQNRPNIQFLGLLLWLLPEKPSPETIRRWERDPATGERELIELLRTVWHEVAANLPTMSDLAGKKPVVWHAKSEAERELRKAIDSSLRGKRSWRRRLDFSRPFKESARSYRDVREKRKKAINKAILNSSPTIDEAHRRRREWATENLPRRGPPVILGEDFVAEVNAYRNKRMGGTSINPALNRQTHRISPMQNRPGTIKDAIKQCLTIRYGRQPTANEIATAQVAYSKLTHRP